MSIVKNVLLSIIIYKIFFQYRRYRVNDFCMMGNRNLPLRK